MSEESASSVGEPALPDPGDGALSAPEPALEKLARRKGSTDHPEVSVDPLVWRAVLSSPGPDCAGDRVFDWEWSGETLPLLVGHVKSALPIAVVRPYKENGRLHGEIRFPEPGVSATADEARRLIEAGVAGDLSIAFTGPGVLNLYGGRDFEKVIVHEVSLVHKAACPGCGVKPREAKGCGSPPRIEESDAAPKRGLGFFITTDDGGREFVDQDKIQSMTLEATAAALRAMLDSVTQQLRGHQARFRGRQALDTLAKVAVEHNLTAAEAAVAARGLGCEVSPEALTAAMEARQ